MLFIFSFATLSASAEELVVSKKLLLETAARLLKSQPKYIEQESFPSGQAETLVFRNKMECGQGTCSQAVFQQQSKKSFYRWVGQIEGRIDKVDFDPKTKTPLFTTSLRMADEKPQVIQWALNSEKKIYEAR